MSAVDAGRRFFVMYRIMGLYKDYLCSTGTRSAPYTMLLKKVF